MSSRNGESSALYEFEGFRLDVAKRLVFRADGKPLPVKTKAFETLLFLVENPGRVIERDEIMEAVWPSTVVEENNLTQHISFLRKMFEETRNDHRFIVTIPGHGYRFSADVRTIGAEKIESIAVMPFVNESGDAELEYFSDGMTETLIGSLSKLPNLQVKARSSVFRYKGRNADAQTIGKELNVGAVLYGQVAYRGEEFVVHVELVSASTENSLWSQTYNRKLSKLIALQGDIVRELVRKLSVRLSGADEQKLERNYTENVEAYQLFLKGQFHLRKLTQPEIKKGIAYLEQAIDADPSYALAFAGIAEAYRGLVMAGEMHPGEAMPMAKTAARKAVEIDDALAEAHVALGFTLLFFDWNWVEAEDHFIQALELDPNSSMAHMGYAHLLSITGRRNEEYAEIKRAREIEPLSPYINAFEAGWLNGAGQPDAALEKVQVALEIDPNFYFAHMIAAGIYRSKKMYSESIAESRRAKTLSPDQTWSDIGLAVTLIEAGQPDESRKILDEMLCLSRLRYVPPYHIALVYSIHGETEGALALLEKSYEQRDPRMIFLKVHSWSALREHPRFQHLVRCIGF